MPVSDQYTALSPDGRTLLLGGADGTVRFADLRTGKVRVASGKHDGVVERGIFTADGRFAITAATDGRIIVWDVRHAAQGEVLTGHHGRITALAVSRDGTTLYSSALDGQVLIWDLSGTQRLGRPFKVGLDSPGNLPRYALSPDGRILAVGRPDGTVGVFDMRTLRPRGAVSGWSRERGPRSPGWGGSRTATSSPSAATTGSSRSSIRCAAGSSGACTGMPRTRARGTRPASSRRASAPTGA